MNIKSVLKKKEKKCDFMPEELLNERRSMTVVTVSGDIHLVRKSCLTCDINMLTQRNRQVDIPMAI